MGEVGNSPKLPRKPTNMRKISEVTQGYARGEGLPSMLNSTFLISRRNSYNQTSVFLHSIIRKCKA